LAQVLEGKISSLPVTILPNRRYIIKQTEPSHIVSGFVIHQSILYELWGNLCDVMQLDQCVTSATLTLANQFI
jgi:hypothetical protein